MRLRQKMIKTYRYLTAEHPGSRSKESQIILYHMYKDLVRRGVSPLPSFAEVGFRCHSQFEEDGILLYIFALVGVTNKVAVEVCAGDGMVCNTANLIINHGYWGYLFDGNETNAAAGKEFYRTHRDTTLCPPRFTCAWITAENVNELIRGAGAEGEIDLLSLDIDGMDYWIWKAIDCIKPRVVVCETNNAIGPDDALTVPYDPGFRMKIPDYLGASLAAMSKLAAEKGYRLVGTHRYGFNAFFVRNEIARDILPAVTPAQCLQDPYSMETRAIRWPTIKDLNWVRV
ncbi:MAG: hypothetical protein ABSF95_01375 [Verrucomicrobiota bacterium]|jgi:hypothetical protein